MVAESIPIPAAPSVRRLIYAIFRDDAEFCSFAGAYFEDTARQFSGGMTYQGKLNLLFEKEGNSAVFETLVRHYPSELDRHIHLLDLPMTHTSLHWICRRMAAQTERSDPAVSKALSCLIDKRAVDYRVGVLGMTSTGKSTLVNSLMGRALLPAETRATTVVPVTCKRGGTEVLIVEYQRTGQNQQNQVAVFKPAESYCGKAVTQDLLQQLCADAANPKNDKRIEQLIWIRGDPGTSASSEREAKIPYGVVLVDTPGLNAYGFSTLEQRQKKDLLLSFDACIYVISVRQQMKEDDVDLLRYAILHKRPILLAITKCDLETDSIESGSIRQGKLKLSREDKLKLFRDKLVSFWQLICHKAENEGISNPGALPPYFFLSLSQAPSNCGSEAAREFSDLCAEISRLYEERSWAERQNLAEGIKQQILLCTGHFDGLFTMEDIEERKAQRLARKNKYRELEDTIKKFFSKDGKFQTSIEEIANLRNSIETKLPSKVVASIDQLNRANFYRAVDKHESAAEQAFINMCNKMREEFRECGLSYHEFRTSGSTVTKFQTAPTHNIGEIKNSTVRKFLKGISKLSAGLITVENEINYGSEHYETFKNSIETTIQSLKSQKAQFEATNLRAIQEAIKSTEASEAAIETQGVVPMSWQPGSVLALVTSFVSDCSARLEAIRKKAFVPHGARASGQPAWQEEELRSGQELVGELRRVYFELKFGAELEDCVRGIRPAMKRPTNRAVRLLVLGREQEQGRHLLALLLHQLGRFGRKAPPWNFPTGTMEKEEYVGVGPFADLRLAGSKAVQPLNLPDTISNARDRASDCSGSCQRPPRSDRCSIAPRMG